MLLNRKSTFYMKPNAYFNRKQMKKGSAKDFPELSLVDLQKCSIFSESSPSQTQGPLLTDIELCTSEEGKRQLLYWAKNSR